MIEGEIEALSHPSGGLFDRCTIGYVLCRAIQKLRLRKKPEQRRSPESGIAGRPNATSWTSA
jgi:hypothetical protein